jgi:hypothetical protein
VKTHVEFRSNAFPAYEWEDEKINPGQYGKRLADYLFTGLQSRGFEPGEPIAEDWGWFISVKNDAFPLWVGCSNYEEYPDDGFLCFIEPHTPVIRKWFKKISTKDQIEALQKAMDDIISNHADIREIKWNSHDELTKPNKTVG